VTLDPSNIQWDEQPSDSSRPMIDASRIQWDVPAQPDASAPDPRNVRWDDMQNFSDVRSAMSVSPATSASADFAPIGDSAPDFGSGIVMPREMEAAGKEFRRVGAIGAQAAGARALNLGALLQQATNPGESIAARVVGLPDEATQAGQMRQVAEKIAPHVAADDRAGRLAEFFGGFAPDMAAAAATGGLAELPAGAGFLARGLHGAMSMFLPAAENTRETYDRSVANGLTPMQAAEQAAVAGGGTLAMGAVPANVPGSLATRFTTGAGIAAAQTEAQRRLANALLPVERQDLEQPLDPMGFGLSALTGGIMAGALGHGGVMDRSEGPLHGESAQEQFLTSGEIPENPLTVEPEVLPSETARGPSAPVGDVLNPNAPEDIRNAANARLEHLAMQKQLTPLEQFEFKFLHDNVNDPGALSEALGMTLPEEFRTNGGDSARLASDSQSQPPLLTEEPQNAALEATGPVIEPTMQGLANTLETDDSLPATSQRISEPAPLDITTTNRGGLTMEGEDAASTPGVRNLIDRVDDQGNHAASSEPHTANTLRTELRQSPLGETFSKLEDSGALRVVHDANDRRAGYWDGRQAVLNAAQIPEGSGYGVALHELTHRAADAPADVAGIFGNGEVARLNRRLDDIAKTGGKDADIVAVANDRIPESTPLEQRNAERLAYFIEEAANRQQSNETLSGRVQTVFRQAIARVKAYVAESRLGDWADRNGLKLSADDYVELAKAAARRQARNAMSSASDSTWASYPSERLSAGAQRDTDSVPNEVTPATAARLNGAMTTSVAKLLPQKNPAREAVRNDVRSALAQRDRAIGTFDKATRAYLKYYDRQLRTTRGSPMLAMKDAIAFEKGMPIPDPKTRPFYAYMRKMLDAQADQIRSYGKGFLDHLVTDYFPHQWTDPDKAASFYGAAIQRRPLGGRKEFTRERVVDSLEEGIKSGMRLNTLNPAELVLQRYASGEKLLTQLKIMDALEQRGLVQRVSNGERVPRGYAHINDPAFGNQVVPDFIAKDLNNHLDPGLTKYALWRGFRWLQNFMLSANLGLSAFHAGMTTLDTIATHADIGWRRLALLGDLKGGLRELANIPVAVFKSPYEGGKLVKQFYGMKDADPNTGAILSMLTEGGGRGYIHPSDLNDSFTKMLRAYDQGDKAGLAKNALPGLIEATSRLISHKLVPAQKMVARVMHAKFRLDEVADALGKRKGDYAGIVDAMNPDALREVAHEINSTIDDRLGQFAYDNLFWNKTFRDFLHATVQSVGWNFGTLRLLLGGLRDAKGLVAPGRYTTALDKAGKLENFQKSRLSDRLSYLITLNAVVGLAGATLQYAMTGEGPKEIKDFFFPRTGRKNRDGSDERLSFPSYVKDEYEFSHHPLTTLSHKIHPIFSKMIELGNNRDFYGTQIYDPDANIPQEVKDVLAYLGKSFTPYSVTGAMKAHDTGQSAMMTALPFIGITPAPGDITKSPFLKYVEDRYFEQQPRAKTQAQADRSRQFADNLQALQSGSLDTSHLSGKDLRKLENAARASVTQYRFGRLSLPQQVRAYELASPDERSEFGLQSYVGRNLSSRLSRLPGDVQADLVQRIRETQGIAQ